MIRSNRPSDYQFWPFSVHLPTVLETPRVFVQDGGYNNADETEPAHGVRVVGNSAAGVRVKLRHFAPAGDSRPAYTIPRGLYRPSSTVVSSCPTIAGYQPPHRQLELRRLSPVASHRGSS